MYEITVEELKNMNKDDVIIIDIRDKIAYNNGYIPNAISMPENNIEDFSKLSIDENKIAVVYCTIGERSKRITEILRSKGIKAYNLEGGFGAWLISNDDILSEKENMRYSRQMILPQIGKCGQEKLKKSKVLIIGAGGLGSPAALYLAAAGVGTLGIVDGDNVDISNMNRQIIHNTANLGKSKVYSAKQRINEVNPFVDVCVYEEFITAENISNIIKDYDFIVDGADNFETKFLINDACVIAKKPFCHSGVVGFEGQVMTYVPEKGVCYRCIFEDIPFDDMPSCSSYGIIGAMAGIIGSIQALEAIKYITSTGNLLTGKMYILNGLTMQSRIAEFKNRRKSCRVCGENAVIDDVMRCKKIYQRKNCTICSEGRKNL